MKEKTFMDDVLGLFGLGSQVTAPAPVAPVKDTPEPKPVPEPEFKTINIEPKEHKEPEVKPEIKKGLFRGPRPITPCPACGSEELRVLHRKHKHFTLKCNCGRIFKIKRRRVA